MPTTAQLKLPAIRQEYMDALMARDSQRARAVVERALAAGADPGDLALDVLTPALHEFGRRWEHGDVSVAQEHYATGVTEGLLAIIAARMRRPPHGGRLAIVACPAGERHGLPARMLGDFLEGAGWEVIVIGSDVPARDLLDMVVDEQPDVVCLSVTLPGHIERSFELLGALSTVDPPPFLAVGGQAWDGNARIAEAIGADVVLSDPRELVTVLTERFPPLPED